jgi:hypothetical protein
MLSAVYQCNHNMRVYRSNSVSCSSVCRYVVYTFVYCDICLFITATFCHKYAKDIQFYIFSNTVYIFYNAGS